MKISIQITLFIAGALLAYSPLSVAQDEVAKQETNVAQILSSVEQNFHKISELQVGSILVTTTTPSFFSVDDPNFPQSSLIAGRQVKIQSDLGVFSSGSAYVDQRILRLSPTNSLENKKRYWWEPGRAMNYMAIDKQEIVNKLGQRELVSEGKTSFYELPDLLVPFPALGKMQVASVATESYTGFFKALDLAPVKTEIYRGLKCWRLEWNTLSNKGQGFARKGFSLICPDRDYKELYREDVITNTDQKLPLQIASNKFAVEKLQKYGDYWIPSRVFRESKRVNFEGNEKVLTESFRITSLQADAVTTGLLFTPLFSPGTRVYFNVASSVGGKVDIAGGDIANLISRLQLGDFSDLQQEGGDLSQS